MNDFYFRIKNEVEYPDFKSANCFSDTSYRFDVIRVHSKFVFEFKICSRKVLGDVHRYVK